MRLGKGCGDEVSKCECPNNSESSTLRAEGTDPLKEMSKIVVDNRSHQEMVTKWDREIHICAKVIKKGIYNWPQNGLH